MADPRQYGFYSTIVPPGVTITLARAAASTGLAPDDPRHGTVNGYGNYRCRCDACKAAQRVAVREWKATNRTRPIPDHVHGTENGYANYYCKCPDCLAAHRRTYTPSPRRALERAKTEAMYAEYTAGMSVEQIADKWGKSTGAVYHRFRTAGLKRRDIRGESAAMYIDYCTGMTVDEVGRKWGVSPKVVSNRFSALGVPRRPRAGGTVQVRVPKGTSFDEANTSRAADAGARPNTVDETHRQVLQLRIVYPAATLAELGARCTPPMGKDSFASHLRRALNNAARVS